MASTPDGRTILKHFFDITRLGQLPDAGLKNEVLHEEIGYRRAGELMFDKLSDAYPEGAADILISLARERQDVG